MTSQASESRKDRDFFPHGLVPAVPTPFAASGELHLPSIEILAEHLASLGVRTVFVAGTTGECHSLEVEERLRLTQRWCEVVRGSALQVWVHVGHTVQKTARELAREAARHGATAVAATAPFYHRPITVEDLVLFLKAIANEVSIPFFYYDIPHLTCVKFPLREVAQVALELIPNFAGVKYTSYDLVEFQRCVAQFGNRLAWLHGFDETLLAGFVSGASGAIGSTYNIAFQIYQRMVMEMNEGRWDRAARLQARCISMIDLLSSYGFVAALKAVLNEMGIPCGPTRPPLRPLDRKKSNELYRHLREQELLDAV